MVLTGLMILMILMVLNPHDRGAGLGRLGSREVERRATEPMVIARGPLFSYTFATKV